MLKCRAVPVEIEEGSRRCRTVFVINFDEKAMELDKFISTRYVASVFKPTKVGRMVLWCIVIFTVCVLVCHG